MADRICEQLMDGLSLRAICGADDMPGKSTVLRWLQSNPDFQQRYILARETQAENIADEILEIADDARNDWMERHGGDDGGQQLNAENIQRSRLRIDARKWMAAKLAPKRYGDKIQQEVSGPDGGPVQVTTIERIIVRPGDIPKPRGLANDRQARRGAPTAYRTDFPRQANVLCRLGATDADLAEMFGVRRLHAPISARHDSRNFLAPESIATAMAKRGVAIEWRQRPAQRRFRFMLVQ